MKSALVGLLVTGLATVCSAAKVSAAADPALRLDPTRVASVIVYHPTLLAADGYFVTYRLDAPGEQYVELTRAAQRAEFEVIEVRVDRSGVREVWIKVEETSEGELILELGRDRIRVVRQTGPAAARVRTELLAEGQGWEADEQSAGGRRTLARSEAEVLLRGALEVLSAARQHFGIGFGRDLSTVRLP
jgi:hypothetical protein